MPSRKPRPFFLTLLAALAFVASACDGPGVGWPDTVTIDEDVIRIQEIAAERVATGEDAPTGPAAVEIAAAALEPEEAVEEAEPEPIVPDAARGAEIYAMNCASCHGAGGAGDGPAGVALDPTPTDHTDGGYMNALSNDHLYKVVAEGGAAVGKSVTMAPWGAVLGEAKMWDVIAHMRTIANPAYEGSLP